MTIPYLRYLTNCRARTNVAALLVYQVQGSRHESLHRALDRIIVGLQNDEALGGGRAHFATLVCGVQWGNVAGEDLYNRLSHREHVLEARHVLF